MKETTKKNLPFIIAVSIVGGIILLFLIGIIVGRLRADYKGFVADMQEACDKYHIDEIVPGEPKNIFYEMHLNKDTWISLNAEQQRTYCVNLYILIETKLWDHKIINEITAPIVFFYVDGVRVASGNVGKVEME